MTKRTPGGDADPSALLHELEVHHAELEVQHGELQAANDELRRINSALVVARDGFQALYQLAPTPYVTVDAGHTIVEANGAAERVLDARREHLVGGSIDVFVDDAGRSRFRAFLAALFAGVHGRCGDLTLVRIDLSTIDAQIDGVLLPVPAGEPARGVLAIVDVTARRLAEIARRQAQDEVLAIVSHDLRGPLNAIGLACDALVNDLTAAEHRECVDAIQRSAARGERLIRNLLGVAHAESGRLTLDLASLDVGELVRQECRDHGKAADAAGSTLVISIPSRPVMIVGDRDRLQQVVANLIGNALIHARGTATEISVVAHAGDVSIVVEDHGPGIPPDELPAVFDKYRQGARPRGGAGLGLAIVKAMVLAHRGTVTVKSQLGQGARFEVVLPRGSPP